MKSIDEIAYYYSLAFVNETESEGAQRVMATKKAEFYDWLSAFEAQVRKDTLKATADEYPTMTRDMVSRSSVQSWINDRANKA